MLDRQHGEIVFECDGCSETLETGEDEFAPALAELRSAGWISRKVGAEWLHLCPGCHDFDPRQQDMF